ncbi:MAG: hypothetical protein QF464_22710, partial [Myxococcota bacterium]|nr:hypothetical protein [Myxococcota bacterium]
MCARLPIAALLLSACATTAPPPRAPATGPVGGWLQWRGPAQDGTADAQGLPTTLQTEGPTLA